MPVKKKYSVPDHNREKWRFWFGHYLLKTALILIVLFFLVSCSTLNFFKKPAGDKESAGADESDAESAQVHQATLDAEKISKLESELMDLKLDYEKGQADLNLQLQNKDADILKLQGDIVKLEKKIIFLEEEKTLSKSSQPKLETPLVLYKRARNLFIEEEYTRSAALFTLFEKSYPQNSLADNALYWLAECYYSLQDHKKAIFIFKDLITKYPKSEKVPDAMLKLGYSYLALDDTNRAYHYFKQVLKKYPFSQASEKAQEKLKNFK